MVDPVASILVFIVTGLLCVGIKEVIFVDLHHFPFLMLFLIMSEVF